MNRRDMRNSITNAAARSAIDASWPQRTSAHEAPQNIETAFESDESPPRGLMRVLETADYEANVSFLRRPNGDPLDPPWHVKVVGPDEGVAADGSTRWVNRPVWSGSYNDMSGAIDAARRQLRRQQQRFDRKGRSNRGREMGMVAGHRAELPSEFWAVYDPEIRGFVKSGFMGKQAFETRHDAERIASDRGGVVVKVTPHD